MRHLTAFSLVLLAACGTSEPVEDYSWVLPGDEIKVQLDTARRAAGDPSSFRADTVQIATDVNGLIDTVLTSVGDITDFEPTWADDAEDKVVWGPWTDSGIDGMLYVQRFEDEHYEWALLGRPEGSGDEDWVALIAGHVDPGATETTGSGKMAIDFDAISGIDPSSTAGGVFATVYDVRSDKADCEALFEGFTENAGDVPVDAAYRYGEWPDGGYMDVVYLADLVEGGALETVVLRSRWVADGQGRGDAYVTDGDLGPLVYQASECWDAAGVVVFDESNADLTTSGDEGLCAFAEPQWNEDGV